MNLQGLVNGNDYRIRIGNVEGLYLEETLAKGKFEKALNDKKIWNKYFTNEYADYAIAGPTLEMLLNSYNEKYNYNMLPYYDTNGYLVNYNDNVSGKLNVEDETYVIKNTNKAWGYWISTRAKDQVTGSLFTVFNSGSLLPQECWKDVAGIRPVVCLKNDVKAKQYTEIWTIK